MGFYEYVSSPWKINSKLCLSGYEIYMVGSVKEVVGM